MGELAKLGELLEESRYAVALTGAGVSTESGIPDFRSDSGLWQGTDPMEVASIDGFREDPARFYEFWLDKFAGLMAATPNPAHRLLAGLESRGRMQAVVTQNIDGLHQKAGSGRVLEVHGTFRKIVCLECGNEQSIESILALWNSGGSGGLPRCTRCGAAALKPKVVLFGEMLPEAYGEAESEVAQADLLLVMGTSLGVYPVAGLVPMAKRKGARVAIINREPTNLDAEADVVVHAELGSTSRALMSMLNL